MQHVVCINHSLRPEGRVVVVGVGCLEVGGVSQGDDKWRREGEVKHWAREASRECHSVTHDN